MVRMKRRFFGLLCGLGCALCVSLACGSELAVGTSGDDSVVTATSRPASSDFPESATRDKTRVPVEPSLALDTGEKHLTLDRIFAGGEFNAKGVAAKWLPGGSDYMLMQRPTSLGESLVRHTCDSDAGDVLVEAEHLVPPGSDRPLQVDDYQLSADRSLLLIYTNSQRVWRKKTRGDYWLLDRASHELRQLGGDIKPATLMFATISPTGRHVAYIHDRNLYVEDVVSHDIRQLTQAPSPDIINGTFDWVYEEELSLRNGWRWSPDGKAIAFWQIDTSGVPRFPLVNNTDALYPEVRWFAYPKVGQQNPACRIGVVPVEGGDVRWLQVPGDPRDHYIARMQWVDTNHVVLQQLNRRQNTLHVMLADTQTGDVTTLLTERDDAWVDVHDEMFWFAGATRFTWISERDGWRHVYLVDRTSGELKLVTPGEFDVIRLLSVDEANQRLYFLASPDNACQQYLYSVQMDSTGLKRVTPATGEGWFEYRISSDCRAAIVTSSAADRPPRTELISLPDHATIRVLEENAELRQSFEKLDRQATEFFRVDIGDGVQLDGWCMLPPQLDTSKKYPVLVHVYGEPAGQTVLDRWGSKNYLWHLMLAQQGYVVLSFDNRGTPAPRGRLWCKCVYKQIGVLAPQEQAAALRAVLGQRSYLDPNRVGIWGWSGGGSMTLNAIFKYPQLYKTAIAIAPVPNERYYDSIYQERYMGLPGDNVEGYLQGSAINFASQLEGNLLLVHGTGDDNCHYQTTEKLINELIRHNKQFTMMAYPNRSHAINEGASTTRHLRQLMTDYLKSKLPAGPR